MKLFLASSLCWAYHPLEVITIAKEYGLDGVEIWAEHFSEHHARPEEVKAYAKSKNIELSVHASSWDLNICSIHKGIQVQSIVELKKSIQLTADLEARHMTFHPGRLSVENGFVDEHWDALVLNTEKLLKYANDKGVTLSIKMMEPNGKEILTKPDAMNRFLKEVGQGIHVTLDVARIAFGEREPMSLKEVQRVNMVHLSDSRNDYSHLPLGEGSMDLPKILRTLEKVDVPVVLVGLDTDNSLFFLKQHLAYLNKHWQERRRIV